MNLKIDPDSITVSGLSSGAYMASQLHISHSATIKGAALFAGGPFACAKKGLAEATTHCMQNAQGGPDIERSFQLINALSDSGEIDDIKHLKQSKLLLVSGAKDKTVNSRVIDAAEQLYLSFVDSQKISRARIPNLGHGFPTLNFGNRCDVEASPYLSACNYDGAGAILNYLYADLKERTAKVFEPKILTQHIPGYSEMLDSPFLYIPQQCRNGALCKLHIALHGCQQNREFIGDTFVKHAGYNQWAEANDIVIVYPQTLKAANNPMGCWDWWGFSSSAFYSKQAPQIQALVGLISFLIRA